MGFSARTRLTVVWHVTNDIDFLLEDCGLVFATDMGDMIKMQGYPMSYDDQQHLIGK